MSEATLPTPRRVLIQILVLTALAFGVFAAELPDMFKTASRDIESVHLFAVPALIALLLWCRRDDFARAVGSGSWLGFPLMALGLGVFAIAQWPFNFGSPRWFALVPTVGGIVLLIGGPRLLWRSLPALILLAVAIPMGARLYAFIIVRPETIVIEAVHATLNVVSGAAIEMDGPDLFWFGTGRQGSIALGEPHRGATLMLTYLTIGLFVIFAQRRPWWQNVALVAALGPIVIVCNFARLFSWGLLSIYGAAPVGSGGARVSTTLCALILCYLLVVVFGVVLARVITEETPTPAEGA